VSAAGVSIQHPIFNANWKKTFRWRYHLGGLAGRSPTETSRQSPAVNFVYDFFISISTNRKPDKTWVREDAVATIKSCRRCAVCIDF
jgi:hypothetical protein